MSYCPTCGNYIYSHFGHRCPPEWEVRDAEDCDDDDWEIVRGIDEDDAATKYAKDCDDNAGEGPRERNVLVREPGAKGAKKFSITFEYSVDYSAWEES